MENEAKLKGIAAYQDGWSKEECLYVEEGPLRASWLEGWEEAETKASINDDINN